MALCVLIFYRYCVFGLTHTWFFFLFGGLFFLRHSEWHKTRRLTQRTFQVCRQAGMRHTCTRQLRTSRPLLRNNKYANNNINGETKMHQKQRYWQPPYTWPTPVQSGQQLWRLASMMMVQTVHNAKLCGKWRC